MAAISLGPGKFYGSSLPRPRFYTDVKYADERIDPPVPVLEPLLSWANEAHWSMGGLSTSRLRLQGRIEGNVEKLREEMEMRSPTSHKFGSINRSMNPSLSPPPAPAAAGEKRKRYADTLLVDEENDEGLGVSKRKNRRLVRKLGDAFDEVATVKDGEEGTVSLRTRSVSRKSKRTVESESESESGSDSGLVLREMKDEQKKRGGKKLRGSYVSVVSASPTSKRFSSRLLRKRSN